VEAPIYYWTWGQYVQVVKDGVGLKFGIGGMRVSGTDVVVVQVVIFT
jgi:hypothetical protein